MENGYVLENEAPQAPENIKKMKSENGIEVSWDEAVDNFGIAYYRLEKDGEFLARIDKFYGYEDNYFIDANGDMNSAYAIEAVDVSGNTTGKITIN